MPFDPKLAELGIPSPEEEALVDPTLQPNFAGRAAAVLGTTMAGKAATAAGKQMADRVQERAAARIATRMGPVVRPPITQAVDPDQRIMEDLGRLSAMLQETPAIAAIAHRPLAVMGGQIRALMDAGFDPARLASVIERYNKLRQATGGVP